MKVAIGVDIGGTKIAAGLVDASGDILARHEISSAKECADTLYESIIFIIEQVLDQASINAQDLEGIGIGVPGKVDEISGIVRHQNNLPFVDYPLASSVKEHFNVDNVVVANDVTMATIAEWKANNEEDNTFVYMTVSTGIACSIMHQGTFLKGAGFSGEMGLLPVHGSTYAEGMPRLEDVASGPAIKRQASVLKDGGQADIPQTTKEILDRYQQGDKASVEIVEQAFAHIAESLYSVICILDPNKIIVGGGVVNNHPYLIDVLKNHLKPFLAKGQEDVLHRIHVSFYKENAGIVGAAFRVLADGSK